MQLFSWKQQTDLQKMINLQFHTKIGEIYISISRCVLQRVSKKTHWGNENAWRL